MSLRKDKIVEATRKAQRIADPAIERHRDELFGTPSDPDPTPIELRQAGRGRVPLEWIGDDGPLAERRIDAAVTLGLIPKAVVELWKKVHERITTRIPGLTHHTMSRERDGMSETYTWGPHPGTYVQAVTHADADKILAGTFGHQFRLVGYQGSQPADVDPIDRFVAPFVDAETTDKVRHVVIEERTPEALSGVSPGSRVGAWTPTK